MLHGACGLPVKAAPSRARRRHGRQPFLGRLVGGVAHRLASACRQRRRGRDRCCRRPWRSMCHLTASVGSAGMPRPAIRIRARRFCAIGLPRCAAFRNSRAAAASSLLTPSPLNCAMANSTMASRLPPTEACCISRIALPMSFGTPRPSLYMVASAYCASELPSSRRIANSSAARLKSCGNC